MPLKVSAWGASDVGNVRAHNEDSYLLDRDLQLYAVADGMGGHLRGEVASALACRVLQERITARRDTILAYRDQPTDAGAQEIQRILEDAFTRGCEEIYQASTTLDSGEGARMGTTLDAVLVVGAVAFTAHVGDGRIYLVRNGLIHRLTVDHSWVQEQIDAGILTADEARRSRQRNVITRALGPFASVRVDSLQVDLVPGDRLLLCTDGLYVRLEENELALAVAGEQLTGVATRMVELSNQRGTRDNSTALVVALDPPPGRHQDRALNAPAEHVETLRHCDLFTAFTYREIVQVAAACQVRDHPTGHALFHEGEKGQECYIVVSGRVDLQRSGRTLSRIGPSGFFGEMSFLDQPRRSASALCAEDTRLLVLPRVAFVAMLRQESALANKLLWRLLIRLAQVVRLSNERLLEQLASMDSADLDTLDG